MNRRLLVIALAGGFLLAFIFIFEKQPPVNAYSELNEKVPSGRLQTQSAEMPARKSPHLTPSESVAHNAQKNEIEEIEIEIEIEIEREDLEQRYQASNINSDYPTLESKLREIHQRRPESNYNASELVDAIQKNSAWERLDEKPTEINLPEKQKFYDTEFIRFDRAKIETLGVGDTMEIPVVHTGETYVMQVEEVEDHGNGNITWRGKFAHEEQSFHVSFTQNNSGLTVGGMNTPDGHYTLEAHDEAGWVMSSDAGLHSSSEPDYIIPRYE